MTANKCLGTGGNPGVTRSISVEQSLASVNIHGRLCGAGMCWVFLLSTVSTGEGRISHVTERVTSTDSKCSNTRFVGVAHAPGQNLESLIWAGLEDFLAALVSVMTLAVTLDWPTGDQSSCPWHCKKVKPTQQERNSMLVAQ